MRLSDVQRELLHRWHVATAPARERRAIRRAYRALQAEAPREPRTFSEKVLVKMAYDRDPLLRVFGDKLAAREWIAARIGAQRLPELYAVTEDASTIDWDALPREFVAKATHGSGGTIVVADGFPADRTLPSENFEVGWTRYSVPPERADRRSMEGLLAYWLRQRFEWWPGRRPEWAYGGITPRILIEEFVHDADERFPSDLRVYLFDGVAQFGRMNYQNALGTKVCSHYLPDGTPIDVTFIESGHVWKRRDPEPPAPPELAEAIGLAEQLTGGLDFVRVDFYRSQRGLLLGELTNYPTGSDFTYDPASFDEWAGKDWHPSYDRRGRRRTA